MSVDVSAEVIDFSLATKQDIKVPIELIKRS